MRAKALKEGSTVPDSNLVMYEGESPARADSSLADNLDRSLTACTTSPRGITPTAYH